MEHISDIKLLDYVAGKLAGAEVEQVRRHIAECTDCANRHEQMRQTWDTLGEWRVDPSAHQIAGRIEALASQGKPLDKPKPKAFIPFRRPVLAMLRIAAAITLGAVGGHLLGQFSTPSEEPTAVISTDKPGYLAALDFEWSTELTWTVLQEDTQSGANQP